MDKPKNLSLKDFIIRKMAVKMRVPESTIDSVITHNYRYLSSLMKTHTEIELSGFGRLYFNTSKAKRKINTLQNHPQDFTQFIEELKTKIEQNELLTNRRRMEKQSDSQRGDERLHSENLQCQNGNMQ